MNILGGFKIVVRPNPKRICRVDVARRVHPRCGVGQYHYWLNPSIVLVVVVQYNVSWMWRR